MRFLLPCILLLALVITANASAQGVPRVSGAAVVAELQDAADKLGAREQAHPDTQLQATTDRLRQWKGELEKNLGKDAAQPVDLLNDARRAQAMRAHAAALRVQAYLGSCTHCLDNDAATMATALALTAERLAGARDAPSAPPPVIESVETADHRALFGMHAGAGERRLVLAGKNLIDAQCPDPEVFATDAEGKRTTVQPVVASAQPARIELALPASGSLDPGSYVLHVKTQRKAFLVGCVAQPEALAVLQVAPAPRFVVTYTLDTHCQQGSAPTRSGSLPALTAYGATQLAQAEPEACASPTSYALSARVTYADDSHADIGPVAQPADVAITAGLPGGLSLQWNPATRQLILRSTANACSGFY